MAATSEDVSTQQEERVRTIRLCNQIMPKIWRLLEHHSRKGLLMIVAEVSKDWDKSRTMAFQPWEQLPREVRYRLVTFLVDG